MAHLFDRDFLGFGLVFFFTDLVDYFFLIDFDGSIDIISMLLNMCSQVFL